MKDSFHWKHSIAIVLSIFVVWILFAILLLPIRSFIDINSDWIVVLSQIGILVVLIFVTKMLGLKFSDTRRYFVINWNQLISIVSIALLFAFISLPLNLNFWMDKTIMLNKFDSSSRLNFPHMLSAYLMAPVIEEGLFRGVILRKLLQRYTSRISVVLSAALFAIIHIDLSFMFYYFICGILTGVMCFKTKSLITTVLLHFFMNIGVDIIYYQSANLDRFLTSPYYWGFFIAGIGIILLFLHKIRCLTPIGKSDKVLI